MGWGDGGKLEPGDRARSELAVPCPLVRRCAALTARARVWNELGLRARGEELIEASLGDDMSTGLLAAEDEY